MESRRIIQVEEKVPFNLLVPLSIQLSLIHIFNNGDIRITETGITQKETTHSHSGNYLLLSEFADNTGSSGYAGTSNVTVTSLAGGRTITAGDDASDEVKITNLTVNSDMALVPTGTVTVDGTTTIA